MVRKSRDMEWLPFIALNLCNVVPKPKTLLSLEMSLMKMAQKGFNPNIASESQTGGLV